ncbi:T9SS type A sorting domain-containing protein [Brumimicrobium aurantiacum]|uniref:T9SS C-terminal target domain-containing protein n=1 Tax=Brumimicrobium aurantiacum TaxID=1737063 RepID=A0A3E1EYA0_9FLAO|nr:T9SS type A sorting domain-containing protein [Brumimicrobium aurantiacum]RFC54453.1 T9SS C-terminal target domain-containing protein [Brumimicrobium aurantiacum]
MGNKIRVLMGLLGVTLILLIHSKQLSAQFNFVYNDDIQVLKEMDTLSMPWCGGMNHPQFSTIDLDFDGVEEIVAFEPENGLISVFNKKLEGGVATYNYDHYASSVFPADIRYRLKLIDYNNDGLKDLFTYAIGGVKVYKNTSNANNGVSWQLVKDPIQTVYFNSVSNLYVASNEIPAFVDVDGDQDIDVLTFHSSVSRVEWHKNLSQETYGHSDSLIFEIEEECWGDFMEDATGNAIELNSVLAPCGSSSGMVEQAVPRHSGGSILALDINGSGLQDLIIGDVSYSNLTMLINGGSNPNNNALMTSYDAQFPSYDVPLNMSNFLTAYYEEVDGDSLKDLVVSTTAAGSSENTKSVWRYKNIGTSSVPVFSFVENDFLQSEMIENGKGAIPVLVDVNNDGLIDLLVANHFNFDEVAGNYSKIQFYQNVGTNQEPSFRLMNENWENFKNSGFSGRVSPSFGDLDGDGDYDMIVGISNGSLFFYENGGGQGPMNFNTVHVPLQDVNGSQIAVPNYATPELFDLDNDGLIDLIIGQGNGPLLYYRNVGSNASFAFELTNPELGQVNLSSSNYQQSIAVPRFVRENGETLLFAGSRSGTISYYSRIDNHLQPGESFMLESDNFCNIDSKGFSAPFISQIRGGSDYDLFVGNELGGVWSYQPGDTTALNLVAETETPEIKVVIYPNPTKGKFTIDIHQFNGEAYNFRVYDAMGRVVMSEKNVLESKNHVNLQHVNHGLYFVEIEFENNKYRMVEKILIE